MSDRDDKSGQHFKPATHILATASTMLGVTTTLIGLIKLLETQTRAYIVDELAGGVVILFLLAAILSFASIRLSAHEIIGRKIEAVADGTFVFALACLAILATVFTWDVI